MYRIIYILFKHVKFQYNNLVKYNSKYSVFSMCCNQSRLEQVFLDLLFISLLIRTLFNNVTWEDSCLDGAWQKILALGFLCMSFYCNFIAGVSI